MEVFSYYLVFLFLFVSKDALCKKHGQVKKDGGKIVGGYNTTIQNIPYQAYLLLQQGNDYYQCGGSIISNTYILTAAHCLTGKSKIFVRVGSTDSNSGGTVITSTVFTQHPQYNRQTSDYDVGVVRLSRAITLDGSNTKAIKLANAGSTVTPGTIVTVTGWGATSENGDTSENLLAVQIPTVSNQDCKKSYSYISSRMFCAGVPEGGKDSCQGDSGGPAAANDTQLGIVSFGIGCARKGYPGVYTNVASVRNWIKTTTGV